MQVPAFLRALLAPYQAKQWRNDGFRWTNDYVKHNKSAGMVQLDTPETVCLDPYSFAPQVPSESYLEEVFNEFIQEHSLFHTNGMLYVHEFVRMPSDTVWSFFGHELDTHPQSNARSGVVQYLMHLLVECGNTVAMEYVPVRFWKEWCQGIIATDMPRLHPIGVDWLISKGYMDASKRAFSSSDFRFDPSADLRILFLVPPGLMVSIEYIQGITVRWLRDYSMENEQRVGLILTLLRVYGEDAFTTHVLPVAQPYLTAADIDMAEVYALHHAYPTNLHFDHANAKALQQFHPALPALASLNPPKDAVDVYRLLQYVSWSKPNASISYEEIPMPV